MKKRIDIKSLVIGALLGAAIVFSVGAVAGAGKRTAWEYTCYMYVGSVPELGRANKLGEDGWKLVCSTPQTGGGIGLIFNRAK